MPRSEGFVHSMRVPHWSETCVCVWEAFRDCVEHSTQKCLYGHVTSLHQHKRTALFYQLLEAGHLAHMNGLEGDFFFNLGELCLIFSRASLACHLLLSLDSVKLPFTVCINSSFFWLDE